MKCYYCGRLANSKEHIPPKSIFKSVECDKFTVPSCDEHNIEKCNQDDSVIKGMLISLANHKKRINPVVKEVIQKTEAHFNQVKNNVKVKLLLNDLPEINTEFAYVGKEIKISDWYSKLSAGIIYTAIKKYEPRNRYDESVVFNFSQYASIGESISKYELEKEYYAKLQTISIFNGLDWIDGWETGPRNYPKELYFFRISIVNRFVFIKHFMFDNYLVFCRIQICDNTKNILHNRFGVPINVLDSE
jgi:hypothetical protein